MMAWTHDQVVLHLAYLVEEGIVHLFYAGPGEIHAAAVADEQAIPGEGVRRDEIAAGVGRVTRRMNDLHLELSDLDHHAVLKDEVLSNVAESMGGDLRAGLVGEPFVVKDVIRMMVRVEDERDRIPVLSGDFLQDAGVEARIDHGRDLGRGIPDQITEVLHRADHVLFEEHRPLGKPMDRVKRSLRSKGSALALWRREGRASGSNDPCRSAYPEGRIWRHGSQPRRLWGSLFRSLTCDIDPRATSLSPSEPSSPWAHAATGPRHPRERRIENLSEGSRHAPDSAHPSQSGSCTELGRPSRTASTSGLSGPTPGHGIPRGRVCVDGPEPSIR